MHANYISIGEASKWSSLSRSSLYDLLKEGTLTRYKVGQRTLISLSELDDFIQGSSRMEAFQ